MTDIVERLRAMSRYEHDDLTIGDEAAAEIEALRELLRICRAERDELAAKHYKMRDALKRQVDNVAVWLETGLPATPEESRSIYEQMRGALRE